MECPEVERPNEGEMSWCRRAGQLLLLLLLQVGGAINEYRTHSVWHLSSTAPRRLSYFTAAADRTARRLKN